MTPEERQLITGLFDRMRGFGSPDKDREAEAVIGDAMRSVPDAAYMLVQSVLVQEHALQEAQSRIEDLERKVRDAETAARPTGSGSFLGGLLGGGRPVSQSTSTSVPPIGSRAVAPPPAYDDDDRRPWSQSPPPQQQAGSPTGGFLRSAMSTAAGVAGGMLAANALGNLFGGGHAHAAGSQPSTGTPAHTQADTDAAVQQARQDWEDDVRADALDDDTSEDGGDI
jgi:uncharacterized protein